MTDLNHLSAVPVFFEYERYWELELGLVAFSRIFF